MSEDQVRDYLQQLSPYKSVEPSTLHPVCWELAHVLARQFSTILQKTERSRTPDDRREKKNPKFSLHPLPFVLALDTTRGESASVVLTASAKCLYTWQRSLQAFYSPAWTASAISLSPLFLPSLVPLSPLPLAGYALLSPCCSCTG